MGFVWNKSTQLRQAERQDAPDQQRVLPDPLYPLRLPSSLQRLGLAKWRKKTWGFNISQSQVTLCQWRETWSDISMFFTLLLTNLLLVASFLLIVGMVGLSNIPAIISFIFSLNHGQASSQVNLFLLLRFFPDPTIDLIFAIKGHVIQVQLFQPGPMLSFFLSTLRHPIRPISATSCTWCSWIIDDILYSKRIVMSSLCNPASAYTPQSTYKLILSTAFPSRPSASSPWRRLRDRRRPKLEPEQWTRSRIRQLPMISFDLIATMKSCLYNCQQDLVCIFENSTSMIDPYWWWWVSGIRHVH